MFWNKRRTPQPEIRFIDDSPKPYVPAGASPKPAAPTPQPPPIAPAANAKVAAANAKKTQKKGGRGVVLLTALAVFGTGVYLKENGAFDNGAKAKVAMPSQLFSVSDDASIVIDAFQGPVEVVRGTEGRVEVTVIKEASAKDETRAKAELSQVLVTSEGDDIENKDNKKITVTATRGGAPKVGDSWVNVKVAVPADANLQVKTSNGTISIGQVEGAITANTSNGSIRINQARGPLELNTTNGKIAIDGEDVLVAAQTQNGGIDFKGTLAQGESRFETNNGRVDVELPPSQSFRIDAKTSHGRIRNEFRNIKYEPNGKSNTRLYGTVGENPQSELKIRTSNGEIRVERD